MHAFYSWLVKPGSFQTRDQIKELRCRFSEILELDMNEKWDRAKYCQWKSKLSKNNVVLVSAKV